MSDAVPSASGGPPPSSAAAGSTPTSRAWLARVQTIQNERLTPELRSQMQARAERSALRDRELRSAVLSVATVQQASNVAVRGLSNAVAAAAAPPAHGYGGVGAQGGAARWARAAQTAAVDLEEARAVASAAPSRRAMFASAAPQAGFGSSGGFGVVAPAPEMEAALALLNADGPVEATAAGGSAGGADFHTLLSELRMEPPEAECAPKFELFTAYLSTVELLRGTLLEQARTSRDLLPPSAAALLDASIKKVDREGMGAPDVPGVWLVHGMAQAAHANHAALSRVTRDLETKLRLAVEPGECPMCLSMCGRGHKPERVLACCHKACAECWAEWAAVQSPPFCPLCRQVEFVEAINRVASSLALS